MKKIYKRDKWWLVDWFLTASLEWLSKDELLLQKEFNLMNLYEITIIYQRNPTRKDEYNFEEEHLRIEWEFRWKLLHIFCCNDIDKFIENLDRVEESMEKNKSEEISEIIKSIKDLPIPSILDNNKASWEQ